MKTNASPDTCGLSIEPSGRFNDNDIYTKTQVAKIFCVTVRTLESWMNRRLISYRKIGGTIRFTGGDIKELLDGHYQGQLR